MQPNFGAKMVKDKTRQASKTEQVAIVHFPHFPHPESTQSIIKDAAWHI